MALSPAKKARHRKYMRERYQNDPEHRRRHRERTDRNDARYRREVDALIEQFRSGGCSLCPESDAACLTAHHIDPLLKDIDVSSMRGLKFSPSRVAAELAKCVCLCANCHAKLHAGHISLIGANTMAIASPQLHLF